ncbi:MAG: hypothetical protein KAW09_08035, partial [Thermoplasmata archaeon]|nr:hypothetical protein [Thermoplasmata archaeon]
RNIDIDEYSAAKTEDSAFFYLSVVGEAISGNVAPEGPRRYIVPQDPSLPDRDRDRVPDRYDRLGSTDFSRDFDNDGTPDDLENHDVDSDGLPDYPFGSDVWLNITIPVSFPQPYAGSEVSLFIGKIDVPPVRGEDVIRVYVDTDESMSTGYVHQDMGADFLIEIRGRCGVVRESVLLYHSGGPGTWKWEPLGDVDIAVHHSQMELAVGKQRLGIGLGQSFDALFETLSWDFGDFDSSDDSLGEVTEDPFAMESGGDVAQSIDGGATWSIVGDVGSSTRAIVANSSNYLFVLKKSGDVFGSGDDGATWTQLGDVGTHQDLQDMAVDGNDYLYTVRSGGEVDQSTDGGVNWNSKGDADSSSSSGFVGIDCDS